MRKYNVFGKKINRIKIIYIILIMTLSLLGIRFFINQILLSQYDALVEEQASIQNQIDRVLEQTQTENYHEIGAIIQFFPNTYDESQISSDIDFAKNVSGLSQASGYQIRFNQNATNPFSEPLPDTVKFVEITLNMTFEGYEKIFVFIENIALLDQIYYIESAAATLNFNEEFVYTIKLYTFYNDVHID